MSVPKDLHTHTIPAVYFSDTATEHARRLAQKFDLPTLPCLPDNGEYLLADAEGVSLCRAGEKGRVRVDFGGGAAQYRRTKGGGELIAKAVNHTTKPTVWDGTGGLGRDSFVLASLGLSVHTFEQHPAVACLLADGLERALQVPEIAFVGRSNAGKSTAINTLTQQNRLAFASKTPGRTQHINLFALGRRGQTDAVLADLPGYGYAAVPQADKLRWQQVMVNYLLTRANLAAVVMLCDPRHGIKELDEALLEVIRPRVEQGLPFLVLLTKADKLSRARQSQQAAALARQFGIDRTRMIVTSSETGLGIGELRRAIEEACL